MPPDLYFISTSFSQIEETVRFLSNIAQRPESEYLDSMEARFSSAYGLMTAIEGVTGVAAHLISAEGFPVPKGAPDSFRILFEQGVLTDREHCERLQAMARFRNLLVHRYWEIDYRRVHQVLRSSLEDFTLFAKDILRYLT